MTSTAPTPTMNATTQLPNLRAVKLAIHARWHRPTQIPGQYLGNILRGALGLTMRKLVCPTEWFNHDCPPCPLYENCSYGQIFAPTPPSDATQLRKQQDLPRPFVIEPPGLHPDDTLSPEGITFHLALFGAAIERLPYFISTLGRLGHEGLGRDRVPFDILQIVATHPTAEPEIIYNDGDPTVTLPQRVITTADVISAPWPTTPARETPKPRQHILHSMGIADAAATPPPFDPARPRLVVRFLTPLLLKSGSRIHEDGTRTPAQEVRSRPEFGILARRLRDRLSTLAAFFGEEPWQHPDFAAIGHTADRVTLIDSRTTWLTRDRRSTRTGQAHTLSGLVGQTTYEFPDQKTFETLAPLLRLGQLTHVGKFAPWGHGAVRAEKVVNA